MNKIIFFVLFCFIVNTINSQKIERENHVEYGLADIKYQFKYFDYTNSTRAAFYAISDQQDKKLKSIVKDSYDKIIRPSIGEYNGIVIVYLSVDEKGEFISVEITVSMDYLDKLSNDKMKDFALDINQQVRLFDYIIPADSTKKLVNYRLFIILQRKKASKD